MKSALLKSIGGVVRTLRERQGRTRRELAQRSGLSERFLADLEGGAGNISVARLEDLARSMGTTAAGILAEAAPPGLASPRVAERLAVYGDPVRTLLDGLTREELNEAHRWLRARFGQSAGPLVALVGLRGAGKSTIGRALAGKLRVPFLELDSLVEEAAGLPLADIFSIHGEAYYRRLAREVLARFLAETGAAVLATPGSIVTDREAFRLLSRRCRTVWLQASADDHWQRVLAQGDQRPSAASPHAREELKALLRAREPLYSQAEITVDTSKLGVRGAVAALQDRLKAERQAAQAAPATTAE
jgi:XRE family aerobic/anaerobic benzoate catabolism transcriptional regulator